VYDFHNTYINVHMPDYFLFKIPLLGIFLLSYSSALTAMQNALQKKAIDSEHIKTCMSETFKL